MTNLMLSMNQFEQLIGLTRDHMRDSLFVYKATSSTGDTCHFGIESAAKAWAKGGTVEAIKVREFKLHTSSPTAAPVGEREAFEREMSKPPFEFCMDRWPDDGAYAWPGNYAAYHTQCAWDAWQARAAMAQVSDINVVESFTNDTKDALMAGRAYAQEALIRFDDAYDRHPSTEPERNAILTDIQLIDAAMAKGVKG